MPRTPDVYPTACWIFSQFPNGSNGHFNVLPLRRLNAAFDRRIFFRHTQHPSFRQHPFFRTSLKVFFHKALSAACLFILLITYHSSLIPTYGQSTTATLSGTVIDQNNAVVTNVSIAVINIAQGFQRSATTNDEGVFVVPLLPPGNYIVKAERAGFTPAEVRDVVLNVNDQRHLKISLKVGGVDQTVDIVDTSPLINESPAVGTVVDRQFVGNLPLNGRSFQSLITLTPGVVTNKTSFSEQGQFSVNGQRANANYFTVDGVSANIGVSAGFNLVQSAGGALPGLTADGGTNSLVSVDALQEFKIQTSSFAPEFGRTPGGQISISTRSGTNDIRGTLFEYFRNDALDASDWFANANRLRKPPLRQNDFGGVIGGPINRNRTFFFFSYEGLRLRLPQTAITTVPSVAVRQAAPIPVQAFLNAYPVPNGSVFANGLAQFSATYSDPSTLNATSIRIDHIFNDKLSLFGRYNYAPSENIRRGVTGGSLNSLVSTRFKTQTLTLGATENLTANTYNEIRANYSRSEGEGLNQLDTFGGAVVPSNSVLFPSFASPEDSLFTFGISGGTSLTTGKNVKNVQRQINFVDNLSIIAGAHQLKFGVDYRRLSPINGPRAYSQSITFSSIGITAAGVPPPAGSVLSGRASTVRVGAQDPISLVFHNISAYGQDTWKLTSRLAVTYGLRWDVNPAPRAADGKTLFTFESLDNLSNLTLTPAGTPLYRTTYSNFAPRIGLAYQLLQTPGREMVMRGGFGIFYDLGSGSLGNASASFPYSRTKTILSVPIPLTQEQATPLPFSLTSFPTGSTAYVSDRELELPRTYQWNLSVEQSLGSNQTLSASYVGAVGRRLLRQEVLRTATSFSISVTRNTASSDYHALQLQAQRRLTRGLQSLLSYTWSHSIDNASTDSFPGTPGKFGEASIDRASSDFDIRHTFNAAITYNIPAPNLGTVGKVMLRNWAVDSIITARSRTPVDIFARIDTTGGVQAFIRPNLVSGIPLYIDDPNSPGGRRFNNTVDPNRPGCKGPFCPPAAGTQGTLGRNSLRGFPLSQVDLALRRQINLTERVKLQFRTEFFNIFNHPNFGDQGGFQGNFLPSAFFGLSTSSLARSLGSGGNNGGFNPLYQVGGPRSIQMALKIQF